MNCSCKSGKSSAPPKPEVPAILVPYSEVKPSQKAVDESRIFNIRLWDSAHGHLVNAEPYVCLEAARSAKRSYGERSGDMIILWDSPEEPLPAPAKALRVTQD